MSQEEEVDYSSSDDETAKEPVETPKPKKRKQRIIINLDTNTIAKKQRVVQDEERIKGIKRKYGPFGFEDEYKQQAAARHSRRPLKEMPSYYEHKWPPVLMFRLAENVLDHVSANKEEFQTLSQVYHNMNSGLANAMYNFDSFKSYFGKHFALELLVFFISTNSTLRARFKVREAEFMNSRINSIY